MNTYTDNYTFKPYAPLLPVKSPATADLEFTTKDGTTSVLINHSGEGNVLVRHFGLLEVFPFTLQCAANMLQFFSQLEKPAWVLDQLSLPPDFSPRHPFRSCFTIRSKNANASEGVLAFSPAIFTADHARRLIEHYPDLVFVAAPEGHVIKPRFAHRLFEDN